MVQMRTVVAALCTALVLASCGGDDLTLTEYVDLINDAADRAGQTAAELISAGVLGDDVTPQQLQAGMERGLREIRKPLQESVDAVDPPDQIADLHELLWSWHADFIEIEETLAVRVGETADTAEGWTSLSDSPEMARYRSALAEGKQLCVDFQADLDATESRGAFDDTPWIPGELKEVVTAALGCQWFPEDPQSIYRYPLP